MAELRTEYLESFDEKFKLLHSLYQQAEWYSIELEYHKLKGTGSTYGVPEVTELCEHLERICNQTKSIDKDILDLSMEILEKIKDKYLNNTDFELSSHTGFQKIKTL